MLRRAAFTALLSASAAASQAGVIDLGTQMGHANLFTLGDFKSVSSDVEGAVISGGSVKVENYAINANNVDAYGKDAYALVARNDVTLKSGQINNGSVYAGGKVSLTSANNPAISTIKPIDFDAAAAYFTALSTDLSALATTGKVKQEVWGATTFTGGGSGVIDVFNVSGDFFKKSNDWKLAGLTAGQTLIFNVSGTAGGSNPNGVSYNPFSGYNVLFNFYEATTLDPRGIIGSVLAPKALVNSSWGVVTGNVVVGSWDSSTQVNTGHYFKPTELAGFRDPAPAPIEPPPPVTPPTPPVIELPPPVTELPPPVTELPPPVTELPPLTGEVPEPGSFGLALAALALLAFSRKRQPK